MSKLFKGLEQIEEAREHLSGASFMAGLFVGKADFNLLLPPSEPAEEKAAGEAFCARLEAFLKDHVDADEIERTARIPQNVIEGLFELGAFGMKIPKPYKGLGFSHKNYGRALTLMASWSNILALTVAVPQSIGIAMPILLFGTEAQKKKYLPRVAREHISAFALTEPDTGSDAANVQTQAVLDESQRRFVINGEKLWCTNGPVARYVTLIARVPAKKFVNGGTLRWQGVADENLADASVHTAFVLDMRATGIEIKQRCQFEGCRGIENAHIKFTNVRLPVENVIGEIGHGLKYALTILNVGRAISVPAICLGIAKQAWQPTLDRANTRITFKKPLGQRQTQSIRLGRMATHLFAMEALSELVWHMADQNDYDIRIEAAIAKMFCSEKTIEFLKDGQIIFGGSGYEKADSKRVRGEPAFGIEQLVRDAEMYRIGEGATDILRPFVAREGLSPHLDRVKRYFDDDAKGIKRVHELVALIRFYFPWFLSQLKKKPIPTTPEFQNRKVRDKLIYIERTSRRLSRAIFYALVVHRDGLRDDQGRQNRIESVGEELLTIAATALHAQRLAQSSGTAEIWELADEFFRTAKTRIDTAIRGIITNNDDQPAALGSRALHENYASLSSGVIQRGLNDYLSNEEIQQQVPPKPAPSLQPTRKNRSTDAA